MGQPVRADGTCHVISSLKFPSQHAGSSRTSLVSSGAIMKIRWRFLSAAMLYTSRTLTDPMAPTPQALTDAPALAHSAIAGCDYVGFGPQELLWNCMNGSINSLFCLAFLHFIRCRIFDHPCQGVSLGGKLLDTLPFCMMVCFEGLRMAKSCSSILPLAFVKYSNANQDIWAVRLQKRGVH